MLSSLYLNKNAGKIQKFVVPLSGTGLQNLRECIQWTQQKHDLEPKRKKPFWKQMSKNFIERYLYLILFTTYCKLYAPRGKDHYTRLFYSSRRRCLVPVGIFFFFSFVFFCFLGTLSEITTCVCGSFVCTPVYTPVYTIVYMFIHVYTCVYTYAYVIESAQTFFWWPYSFLGGCCL